MKKAYFAQTEVAYLLDQIKQHDDDEYRAGLSRTAPTTLKLYGVRVPDLRKIARNWYRAHKQTAPKELLTLAETLWNGESREERVLAVLLVAGRARSLSMLTAYR